MRINDQKQDNSEVLIPEPGTREFRALVRTLIRAGIAVFPATRTPLCEFKDRPAVGPYEELWERADRIAVRLDSLILIDDDGYKFEGDMFARRRRLSELRRGAARMQWSTDPDKKSVHHICRVPDDVDAATLKHSADGFEGLCIDVKRGNQVVYLKPGKAYNLEALLNPPEANSAVLEALRSTRKAERHNVDVSDFTEEDMQKAENIVHWLYENKPGHFRGSSSHGDQGGRDNWLRFVGFARLLQGSEWEERVMALAELIDEEPGATLDKMEYERPAASFTDFLGMICELPAEARTGNTCTDADLMDDVQPLYGKKDWMIRGFQNFASTFELVGESNIGKSFELLSRMACVASGVDYMGWPVRRAHCFYFDAEGGEETQTRLAALRQEFGDALDWLHVVDIQANGWDMTHADDRQKIISYVLRHSAGEAVGIIAFDSLNQAMVNYRAGNFDENSATDMGRVASALKTLASVTGGCAGVVHHPAKSAKGTTLRTGRGSGALHGAVDFVYFLEQPQPGTLNIYTEKARGTVKKLPFGLKLVTVQLAGVEPEPEPENKPFDGSKWGIRPAADPQQYQSNSTLFAVPVRQAPFETVAGKAGRDAVKVSGSHEFGLIGPEKAVFEALERLQDENPDCTVGFTRAEIRRACPGNGSDRHSKAIEQLAKRRIFTFGKDKNGRQNNGRGDRPVQYLIPMYPSDWDSAPEDDQDD